MEIHTGKLAGSRLIEDYQSGAEELAPFYRGSPWEIDPYRAKVEAVDERFDRAQRRELASLIQATTPGAAARLEDVVSGDGLFVTTGQQAGLFGGPLFTVHKILSAVQLARTLEAELKRPVVPLFWVASDDHDWDEVNHIHVLDRTNDLQRIGVESPADVPQASMRNRRLGAGVEKAFDQLVEALPTTEFAGPYLESIRGAYRPDRTVAGAFAEIIAELFSEFDLLIVDGGQPGLKRMASGLMARELERSAEHEAILETRTRDLEAAGYHAQVPVLSGATNLFFEDAEHGRQRILRDGDDFLLRQSQRRVDRASLLEMLRDAPEHFSPNVVLRPIVENAVFPTIAYVGGPAEVSYFAQLSSLFPEHGIEMPVVFPRFSVMLVERKVRKVMDKFDVGIEDFRVPSHELAARVLRDEIPAEVSVAIGGLRAQINEGYAELVESARAIDPTLKGPIQRARNASHKQLGDAEKRITQALKRQNVLGLDQLEKSGVNLFPNGTPQERVLNAYQYLVRYGSGLLSEIADSMSVRIGTAARSAS